ncbi:MAG: type VI secretion system baseplate subunit TssF [Planctomycetes bacterium]|nr:type VI secretion system baseplate subunit TssF [Planctomycetota bacterium]
MKPHAGDEVHKAFLQEMQALENLRVSYTGAYASAGLVREDPEVRRLLEAIALLSARSRVASQRSLLATQRRLFQQFFSFLLSPCPARGLLQLEPTGRLADTVELPRGTEVQVSAPSGASAMFATQRAVRVLPLRLVWCETLLRVEGPRVVLGFRAPFPRQEEINTLSLHVNHLDDYPASLTLVHLLQRHLERAFLVFEDKVTEDSDGPSCSVSFGEEPDEETIGEEEHPLQEVRSFFHAPQRDLFMNVTVPETPPRWHKFSIVLDLSGDWPRALRLTKDMFELFTVPIANLQEGPAEPLLCEGLESRTRIRHPNPDQRWEPHSVRGVYTVEEMGLVPIRPGIVTAGTGSYELERTEDERGEAHWIRLRFPQAFAEPRSVAIEALWLQPGFSEHMSGHLKAQLHARAIPGLRIDLRGGITPHASNPLASSFEGMLQLLSLRSKTGGLTREELDVLLEALGVLEHSPYASLQDHLGELKVETLPEPRERGGGRRHVYRFDLGEFDVTLTPLIDAGIARIAEALRAWTTDARVTVEAHFGGDDPRTVTYE